MTRLRFATTLVAAMALAVAPAVGAQPADTLNVAQSTSINDDEIKSFVEVVLEVRRINIAYLPMFESAGTTEEQDKVVAAAQAEVEQVISGQGMSRDRFEEILAYTQTDGDLAERVRRRLKEAR